MINSLLLLLIDLHQLLFFSHDLHHGRLLPLKLILLLAYLGLLIDDFKLHALDDVLHGLDLV